MSNSPDDIARECLSGITVYPPTPSHETIAAAQKKVVDAIQDAFELGFKAAGGAIAPDKPAGWQLVEIALSRDEIDALCGAMTVAEGECRMSPAEEAFLSSVRDKISLFDRSK